MIIDKVKQIAREKYGRELTDIEAKQYAQKQGKLSDDELGNVSGGGCDASVNNPPGLCPICETQLVEVPDAGKWCSNCRKYNPKRS